MKLYTFIIRHIELIAYLFVFPPETPGLEIVPLPTDKIMVIIYHLVPTKLKYKMIEQGFS